MSALRKKTKILLAFLTFLLLLTIPSLAYAREVPGWTQDCTTPADCVSQYGEGDWVCVSNICSFRSPFGKFQKNLEDDFKNKTISFDSFIGGSNGFVAGIMNTGLLAIAGPSPTEPIEPGAYKPGGAIGVVATLIGSMYANPPASGVEYLADLSRNFGIAKPAYAQGIGFGGLSNILPLWKAFRNISYLLFVIVFVVMGLAIMFRMKISPQAVITIESALPKIVIALILVTFSYAIAGLLIDLIYVLITLGVALVGQTGWIDVAKEQQKYLSLSFSEGVGLVFGGGIIGIYSTIAGLVVPAGAILAIAAITTAAGIISLNPIIIGIGAIILILPALIVAVIALYAMFKLFLALLMCYINIIISVITAPIQILMGALPGGSFGFGSWIKNLLTNILVFPATAIFLLLGWLLSTQGHGPSWTPPVISMGGDAITKLIGFGMLLMAPKIPEYVKVLFEPKAKVPTFGQAIGATLGGPVGLASMGYTGISPNVTGLQLPQVLRPVFPQAFDPATGKAKELFPNDSLQRKVASFIDEIIKNQLKMKGKR